MESSEVLPGVGDLVLPTYYRVRPGQDGKIHGIIVRQDGIFYDILWGGKGTPEEYWTIDDFYVVGREHETR
jgi:hypothetical protein